MNNSPETYIVHVPLSSFDYVTKEYPNVIFSKYSCINTICYGVTDKNTAEELLSKKLIEKYEKNEIYKPSQN